MRTINQALSTSHVATILVIILAVVGGVVAIIHPASLSFASYLNDMVIAVGALGIGRGLGAGLTAIGSRGV